MPSLRKVAWVALWVALSSGVSSAAGRPPATPVGSALKAEIEKIVRERLQAAARGDKAAWRRHIAADCVWTGPGLTNGTTADAEREISANKTLQPGPLELRDFEVHLFGDAALATYVSIERPVQGTGAAKRFRKTDTYLRRDGRWQLISAAEVYVAPRPTVRIDPAVADAYAGEYELDAAHRVRVWREGDRLLSQATGEDKPSEFLAAEGGLFFIDGEIGDWLFGKGDDGKIDRLIYRLAGNRDVVLRRIE